VNTIGGPAFSNPFGDANSEDIDERIKAASCAVTTAQGQLNTTIALVGMSKSYQGQDPQMQLQTAIEAYARAVARHEMLTILRSEDFFLAMTRSAGFVGDPSVKG
jgi:hypothetical protein